MLQCMKWMSYARDEKDALLCFRSTRSHDSSHLPDLRVEVPQESLSSAVVYADRFLGGPAQASRVRCAWVVHAQMLQLAIEALGDVAAGAWNVDSALNDILS